jgi:hypothetical protein
VTPEPEAQSSAAIVKGTGDCWTIGATNAIVKPQVAGRASRSADVRIATPNWVVIGPLVLLSQSASRTVTKPSRDNVR